MKNLLSIKNLTKKEFLSILELAEQIKKNPKKYKEAALKKTLLMIFEVPSLRTRLSFETAMTQLGGHAINYYAQHSPWGQGKEIIEDVGKVISRYADAVMVRIHDHKELQKLEKNSSIPVINGLTSYAHPCQILADFLTIKEKKKTVSGLKIAYLGDANNNVTHDLMFASAILGSNITIACPKGKKYEPLREVLNTSQRLAKKSKAKIKVTHDPKQAIKNADVVITDSWMSYRIPKILRQDRLRTFKPYQVNKRLFSLAKKNAIFMHCLPAMRGYEMTADIIDSKRSVVFDEAENRLHAQKALLLKLLKL